MVLQLIWESVSAAYASLEQFVVGGSHESLHVSSLHVIYVDPLPVSTATIQHAEFGSVHAFRNIAMQAKGAATRGLWKTCAQEP